MAALKNHLRNTFAALALAAALAALPGCGQSGLFAGVPPIDPPAPAAGAARYAGHTGGQLYAIPGHGVVDEDGRLVLAGAGLTVLHDTVSGAPQAIAATRPVPARSGEEDPRRLSVLYGTDGTLLADWQEIQYAPGVGEWVVASNASWHTVSFAGPYRGWLYNIRTGETRHSGASWLIPTGDGRALVRGFNAAGALALVDSGGETVPFADAGSYTTLTAFAGRLVAEGAYLDGSKMPAALLDAGTLQAVYTCADGNLVPLENGYLWLTSPDDGARVLDGATLEIALDAVAGGVQYYDGENAVLWRDGGALLADAAGEVLAGPFDAIEPLRDDEGRASGRFLAYRQTDEALCLLSAAGNVTQRLEVPGLQWAEPALPGHCIVHTARGYYNPDDESQGYGDEERCLLVRTTGTLAPVPLETHYFGMDAPEGLRPSFVLATRWVDARGNSRIDLLAATGEAVVTGLEAVHQLSPTRLVATRGFSVGLMDYEGNWLYRASAFTALEDE